MSLLKEFEMNARLNALQRISKKALPAVILASVSGLAMAQEVDIAPITSAGVTVAAIGGAVFVVMVGIKVFKWIRRAL